MSDYDFIKLFTSITNSTIWSESSETRVVWITMLAMADRMGRICTSIPGLAYQARVTVKQAEEAVELFLAPDQYSRSKAEDGRRILPIDGGWQLVNYKFYRAKQDPEAVRESKRKYIRRIRGSES